MLRPARPQRRGQDDDHRNPGRLAHRGLRGRGPALSILRTTHYMDEAERLCDRVAVVDHGRVIALGSPGELIAQLGGEHLIEFALADGAVLDELTLRVLPAVVSVHRLEDA